MYHYDCTDFEHSIQDYQTAQRIYCSATSHADKGCLEVCIAGSGRADINDSMRELTSRSYVQEQLWANSGV
jgi:hypothetical protein